MARTKRRAGKAGATGAKAAGAGSSNTVLLALAIVVAVAAVGWVLRTQVSGGCCSVCAPRCRPSPPPPPCAFPVPLPAAAELLRWARPPCSTSPATRCPAPRGTHAAVCAAPPSIDPAVTVAPRCQGGVSTDATGSAPSKSARSVTGAQAREQPNTKPSTNKPRKKRASKKEKQSQPADPDCVDRNNACEEWALGGASAGIGRRTQLCAARRPCMPRW